MVAQIELLHPVRAAVYAADGLGLTLHLHVVANFFLARAFILADGSGHDKVLVMILSVFVFPSQRRDNGVCTGRLKGEHSVNQLLRFFLRSIFHIIISIGRNIRNDLIFVLPVVVIYRRKIYSFARLQRTLVRQMAVVINVYAINVASANSAFIDELSFAILPGIHPYKSSLRVFIQDNVVLSLICVNVQIIHLNAVEVNFSICIQIKRRDKYPLKLAARYGIVVSIPCGGQLAIRVRTLCPQTTDNISPTHGACAHRRQQNHGRSR